MRLNDASFKKRVRMKTRILIIAVFLCILFHCSAIFAQEGYKVLRTSQDTVEIDVYNDCVICVAEIVTSNLPIYGDNGFGGQDNSLFEKNLIEPNKGGTEGKGVKITRDNGKVILEINYKSLKDTKIKLCYAENHGDATSPNYYPSDNTFFISLKKNVGGEIQGMSSIDSLQINEIIDGIYYKIERLESKVNINAVIFSFGVLVWILICACGLFFLNRKTQKALARDFSDLRRTVENLKVKRNSQIIPQQDAPLKKQTIMLDEDIKKFIVEQVRIATIQVKQAPTIKPTPTYEPQNIKNEPQERDTDNVKYNQADNSFSIEQTDIHIFRIYSQNGAYYYTIVDDSAVREELIGMLQMFEGCITYQTTSGVAKRVEPVTDGILRKEGNKFYVDNNNKLVVQFI